MCTYCNKKGHAYLECNEMRRQTLGPLPKTTEQRTQTFVPTLNIRQDEVSICAFLRNHGAAPCLKEDSIARHKKNNERVHECAARSKLSVVTIPYRKKISL